MQDAANIAVYLPRSLHVFEFIAFTSIVIIGLGLLLFYKGGRIQKIVTEKSVVTDVRFATLIDFIYCIILFYFKLHSKVPMSTTWVFIGLLAGRELGMALMKTGDNSICLSYANNENHLQCGMYYNVQGKTLSVVSINREPDIYSSPFHSLNLNLSKKFGNKNQIKVNLGAKNILNSKKEMLTDSFNAIDEIYSSYDPGREFFIKLSYNLK